MNILAIIPARSGSKRLPSKNILKLGGSPLISYTINSAKKSKLINKIFVSTDSNEVVKICESHGIKVPILRPKRLAQDKTSSISVIKHVLLYLQKNENYEPDIVLLLQPTSPFRTTQLIDKSIQLLKKSKVNSVISVKKINTDTNHSFYYKNKMLIPYQKFSKNNSSSKNLDLFFPTGSVYTFWNNTLKNSDSIYGNKILPIFSKHPETIDIDDIFDLFVSEMTLLHWKKFKLKHANSKITF